MYYYVPLQLTQKVLAPCKRLWDSALSNPNKFILFPKILLFKNTGSKIIGPLKNMCVRVVRKV